MFIDSERLVKELERNAYRVIGLIRRGIKFTPTQPDALVNPANAAAWAKSL